MNRLRAFRLPFPAARWIAPAIFLAALALYVRTAAPTLGGAFDSEEFQHVAHNLDVAHATGYPLYLVLGKIFTTLVPLGDIAYRMNLLSAVLGAATVVVVYWNAQLLTRQPLASLSAAALFATNAAVWRQAGVASVGPLHALLVAAIVWAMLLWRERRAPLTLAALCFGLSLAHHRTTILLAPAIAALVLRVDAGILRRPRELAQIFFWLILPLTFYLYIPIFGNHTPWYVNTFEGFVRELSGGDAGDFTRATPLQLFEGVVVVSQYLLESFGYLGLALVLVGIARRAFRNSISEISDAIFLGLATLAFAAWGIVYGGEPDRYLVLPFLFLIYWFALGAGAIEARLAAAIQVPSLPATTRTLFDALRLTLALVLALLVIAPFPSRWRIADWSGYVRQYQVWDEIFTLPLPQNAVLVGNWPQLNAMRYLQRVENRRPDLQFVGTLYDAGPQTDAARDAFIAGQPIFLAPGIALPNGTYRYAQLGPLLQVRESPQTTAPAAPKNIALTPALTLAHFEITTALETYAPTTHIAPNRTVRVTLDWRAENAVRDFLVRVRLYDPEARVIAQRDEAPVRGLYLAPQWARGEYVRDVHNVQIPAGTPPGAYTLKLQTLDAETKKPASDEITLTMLTVTRATNLTRDQVFVQRPFDLILDDRLAVWGSGGFDGVRRAGDTLTFNLVWFAREPVAADTVAHFALRDATGKTLAAWTRAPIAFYATREWQRGEILKAYYDVQLPTNAPPGMLTLAIGIDANDLIAIGKLEIAP